MGGKGDGQLVDRFRQTGEIRYFDELVRRHIRQVRALIYPMVLNDADADDLTQDVFLRVIHGIPGFRQRAEFSTWLYRITMNTARNFLKRNAGAPVIHHRDVPPEHADPGEGPSATLEAQEEDSRIRKALAELSPRLRAAITLTAIHCMSAKEAAAAEGCLAATMYWRLHEARRILRERLDLEPTP